jgi:predicted O-methyltransferase YrrM
MLISSWQQVPGWFSFREIYDQVVEEAQDDARFVELGTALGRSALYMAEAIGRSSKNIHFTVVDLWSEDGPTKQRFLNFIQPRGGFYNAFQWVREHHALGHLIHVQRAEIVEAAARFVDSSTDFVFLDAGHTYEKTHEAIHAWVPKIKKNGILAGDDYLMRRFPGVVRAVDELLPERSINGKAFIWRKP